MIILGYDGGNKNVKIVGEKGVLQFPSDIGEYRERKLHQAFDGDNDMEFEFKGRRGFAGALAQYESEFAGTMMGDTKAHDDLLIRVLLGLHRYDQETEFKIVVGQPIKRHTEVEKVKIKNMLKGTHEFTLNKITKQITIHDVEVGAEGAVAFWSNMKNGVIRIIDLGGGTCNLATIKEGKFIDKESTTLSFGANSTTSTDTSAMCRAIAIEATKKKWDIDDQVFTVGGKAEELIEPMSEYFSTIDVLRPKYSQGGSIKILSPLYATAVGLFNVAKVAFK